MVAIGILLIIWWDPDWEREQEDFRVVNIQRCIQMWKTSHHGEWPSASIKIPIQSKKEQGYVGGGRVRWETPHPAQHSSACLKLWVEEGQWGKLSSIPTLQAQSLKSCLTLCNPMDCSPPGSSVHSIFQARILEWIVIPSFRGSFHPRDWTYISCLGRWILYHWTTWEIPWTEEPSALQSMG